MDTNNDQHWMHQALEQANLAKQQEEVPVGAVIVLDNQIIGKGFNQPISSHDPSAHAEIMALRSAANTIQNYRLINSTLYVTLEPCMMCLGAMVHARIQRLVFGAYDPKTGVITSRSNFTELEFLNHKVKCTGGILAEKCGNLLTQFFQAKR